MCGFLNVGVDRPLERNTSDETGVDELASSVIAEENTNHCRDVSWQPMYSVCVVAHHAKEYRSPESVCPCGWRRNKGRRVRVFQT